MMTRGTEDGRGMTREQSVEYLKWLLDKLSEPLMGDCAAFQLYEFEPPTPIRAKLGSRNQFTDAPYASRRDYDQWISWAMGLVCDWPENLFSGQSTGDGSGQEVDWPENRVTSDRVRKAAEKMKFWIYGQL